MTKGIALSICLILLTYANPVLGKSDAEPTDVLIGEGLRYVEIGGEYLWLATNKGVSQYHFDTKKWDYFTTRDGLINNKVNCIAVEWKQGVFRRGTTGRVWFGTDSGLSVYDMKKNQWHNYTVKNGLIENKITCISARNDWIWIGTEKGVSAYERKKHRWQSHSALPGIKTPSVTSIYHDYNYVWIGTNSGLA